MAGESETEKRRKRAQQSNDKLLINILKTILIRAFAVLVCLAATAGVMAFIPIDHRAFFLALVVPVGTGCIFSLLLFDAIGQWHEVKGRKWSSLTPRFVKSASEGSSTSNSSVAKPTS